MIIIDNYDSFTYNLVEYVKILGVEPKVFKNDEISIKDLKKIDFSSIIISPGPGRPENAGISNEVIREFHKTKKILGVCLGHQSIAAVFGSKIIKSPEPCHGKTSPVFYNEDVELFKGLEQGFNATRYHSLIVDKKTITDNLEIIAWTTSGLIMGIKLKHHSVYGVQFHPEAILTTNGINIIKNFIDL